MCALRMGDGAKRAARMAQRTNRMRRASKIDTAQPAIVEALRRHPIWVGSLADKGDGWPDLLCVYRKTVTLLEVKTGGAKLRPNQRKFFGEYPAPVYRVSTPEEALAAVLAGYVAVRGHVSGDRGGECER